jgi:hypothetical protein
MPIPWCGRSWLECLNQVRMSADRRSAAVRSHSLSYATSDEPSATAACVQSAGSSGSRDDFPRLWITSLNDAAKIPVGTATSAMPSNETAAARLLPRAVIGATSP